MTKGEAISRLENTAWLGTYSDSVKIEEAIRMAADALGRRNIGKWWGCRCSQCGRENNRETNYCPHCGAKMEGVEDDN